MLELWLIRHGETDWNREGRIQGQQHNPLSALGELQARRLGLRLMGERFDVVYCSDLKRAVQTAEIAMPGAPLTLDQRLREISRGTLEGHLGAELVGEAKDVFTQMQRDLINVRPPQGENYRDLSARAVAWLESLPARGKVAAVTHGGVIYTLLHHIVGFREGDTWRFTASNTGITKLHLQNGRTTIVSINDTAHLEPQPDLRVAKQPLIT
jgi:broad specificity phosphatase PhoE